MTLPARSLSSYSVGAVKLENEKRTIFLLQIQSQQGGKCLHVELRVRQLFSKLMRVPASIEPSPSASLIG